MFQAENYSLAELNAFRFNHSAEHYVEFQSTAELLQYAQSQSSKPNDTSIPIVFGHGTNTVLSNDITGTVVRFTGSAVTIDADTTDDSVLVTAQAGKNWHELVTEVTGEGLYGIENLSLIPGTCGAAPVQNIGAYGVELSDTLISVTALNWSSGMLQQLSREECEFAYRDSRFKCFANDLFITDITLKLKNVAMPETSYGAIQQILDQRQIANPTPQNISDIVCEIRQSKLPDPTELPNAGSFFKNPVVSKELFEKLAVQHPDLPSYSLPGDQVKLAAGWLIEKAGLKGFTHSSGHVAIHDKQALVLVHRGGGNAGELLELAQLVKDQVKSKFDVLLEREPVLR